MLSMMFGIPRGAARLFVASHPAWAAETAGNDSGGSIGLGDYRGRTLSGRNYAPALFSPTSWRQCAAFEKWQVRPNNTAASWTWRC